MPAYPIPPERDPIPTPLSIYGNNATVACPCGKVVAVVSRPENTHTRAPAGHHNDAGRWECWCGRWYKGWPEGGQHITHILVWDIGAPRSGPATYLVRATCADQRSDNPIGT